ncbi:hypothetical protein [Kitasatospora aureofaciens]|uniref:hypothetical protein n=1 Tax=Kitasatospora aureofaciens TaxID=1894 RepID=UPI0036F481C2
MGEYRPDQVHAGEPDVLEGALLDFDRFARSANEVQPAVVPTFDSGIVLKIIIWQLRRTQRNLKSWSQEPLRAGHGVSRERHLAMASGAEEVNANIQLAD